MFEIALTRMMHQSGRIDSPHYYLGYYLPTCPKLQYKAAFGPHEILNRATMMWERCVL